MLVDMPICVACANPLEPGVVRRNAWGQRLHPTCPRPPRCSVCQAWTAEPHAHADGRQLCAGCVEFGVVTAEQVAPLLDETLRLVRSFGLRVEPTFPVQVVDRATLLPFTQDPRALGHTASRPGRGRRREVERVLLVSHLRPGHFRGVVAHELTHAYLHQRVPIRPSRAITEGLCNYVASLVYQAATPDPDAAFHLAQLEADPHPDYGAGFRTVRDALRGDDGATLHALATLESGEVPSAFKPRLVPRALRLFGLGAND